MSDNPDYQPIPGQTPLTLPPKQPAEAASPAPAAPPAAAPVQIRPVAAAPVIAKLPTAPKFVSPMPKIEESNNEIPAFMPVIAGIAAAVTIAFSILLYLKR